MPISSVTTYIWLFIYLAHLFSALSKSRRVSGTADENYSLYADIQFADGTLKNGIFAPISTGTHDWQRVSLNVSEHMMIYMVWYVQLETHSIQYNSIHI